MKLAVNLFILLFLFSSGIMASDSVCESEQIQIKFSQLMQDDDLFHQQKTLDEIVLRWDNYKCEFLEVPGIAEIFVMGHIDFLVEELLDCLDRSEQQDIVDASLEAIKSLGLLHYLYSDHENGLTYLAIASQLFQDVKFVVNDEMLDLYHWMEFKRMVEDLNYEWSVYAKLSYEELSLCNDFESEEVHEGLVLQVSECMDELLACFESAYRPDFQLPCTDMEDALDKLFIFYCNSYTKPHKI